MGSILLLVPMALTSTCNRRPVRIYARSSSYDLKDKIKEGKR